MVNFRFLKTQIKSSIWVAVGFGVVPILMSLFMFLTPYFYSTEIITSQTTYTFYTGAIDLLGATNLFGVTGTILATGFAVTLAVKLVNAEISKGYMSSWLSLPMSRSNVFLAKLYTVFIAALIAVLPNLLMEFLFVAIQGYSDFGGAEAWILIKANLGLLLMFFFLSAIAVTFSLLFNKTAYVIVVSVGIPAIFIVFSLLSQSWMLFNVPFLKNLKYITFLSLFDFNQLRDNSNLNFIWKYFLLFGVGSALYVGSTYIFKYKNLFI